MSDFLIDANLPYHISIWQGENFIHQFNLGDKWPDEKIWDYSKKNKITIVTKDADFSNRIMMSSPPPKVIHFKMGNMKLNELNDFIIEVWDDVVKMNKSNKVVSVYKNKIEGLQPEK